MIATPHIRIPLLDEILVSDHLRPQFQAIVHLNETAEPFGYEALTRFRSNNPLLDPEFLFLYAGRKGRTCDLDVACLRASLSHGTSITRSAHLFVNLHPSMLAEVSRWIGVLEEAAASGTLALDRLVVEVTEQGSLDQPQLAAQAFDTLRSLGVRLALDDVGIAHSHLSLIDRIRPSFIKISRIFGTGFEDDATKTKIVRNIVALADDFAAEIVLEGIETAETAHAARDIGIPLGQGYFFSRPQDVETLTYGEGLAVLRGARG